MASSELPVLLHGCDMLLPLLITLLFDMKDGECLIDRDGGRKENASDAKQMLAMTTSSSSQPAKKANDISVILVCDIDLFVSLRVERRRRDQWVR